MNKKLLGVYTALVTPFASDLSIDIAAFRALVVRQISSGVHGLVVGGTTGESPTLAEAERFSLLEICLELANQRVPVIVGLGSNSTALAIEQTQAALKWGVAAIMHTTPWYNKPTQEGLYQHFRAISECSQKPILLYNVPGRTSVDLAVDTIIRLAADCPNIIGIKDAHISAVRTVQTIIGVQKVRPDFSFMSGEDSELVPVMAAGGDGVVSVTSNFAPQEMVALFDGKAPNQEYQKLIQLIELMFSCTNPIPVKTALSFRGELEAHFRLPLCALNDEQSATLRAALKQQGWL